MKKSITTFVFVAMSVVATAQVKNTLVDSLDRVAFSKMKTKDIIAFQNFRKEIEKTDKDKSMLVTNTAFNMLMQRSVGNYLTGTSDFSLSSFYATYSSDDDKLSLSFNIPLTTDRFSKPLSVLLTPIFEANLKNSFATLYKEGKWQSDLRAGAKLTILPGQGMIKFWPEEHPKYKRDRFEVLRSRTYVELLDSVEKVAEKKQGKYQLLGGETRNLDNVYADKIDAKLSPEEKKKIQDKDAKELERELLEQLAQAEVGLVKKEEAANVLRSWWISLWGMMPLTETEKYFSPDYTQAFSSTRFKNWEGNVQVSYLRDYRRWGTFLLSSWFKVFNNNSALADLMTEVDYDQYQSMPSSSANLTSAIIESERAFIGQYDKFTTGNLNLQFVYFAPLRKHLVKPGISIRYEMNFGTYSPNNLRIGIPLAIQGKEKPINIELQCRLNDLNNYKNVPNYSIKPTLGISLGLPITMLYE